ncbi:hypothetical protein FACS1894141_0170 [Spirochaetia bacterium]|nr:hypothetical protein FACS1894141_0170 [Spirochaetia bacterium]
MKKHAFGLLYVLIFSLMIMACASTGTNRDIVLPEEGTQIGSGTGFFISNDGILVTCAHVIDGGDLISVRVNNIEYRAEILAKDSTLDLAILKINYKSPYNFKIGAFNSVELGNKIYVLGFPLAGLLSSDIRLTDGSVSAKSGFDGEQIYFQISAPVQPGNSGGPIINSKFEVIGVAAAKLDQQYAFEKSGSLPENVNFGIKSGYVTPLLDNFKIKNTGVSTLNDASKATVQILSKKINRTNSTLVSGGNDISITITNNTGYAVHYVYITPVTAATWGQDRLGSSEIISDGGSARITLPSLNTDVLYDICLEDEDGDTYTKVELRLSNNQNIIFTMSDWDPSAYEDDTASITIVNKTGYTVYYVYVSPSSSDSWGDDQLGSDSVLVDGSSIRVTVPSFNSAITYDICLIDEDEDTYTKTGLRLSNNQRIEFTMSDID